MFLWTEAAEFSTSIISYPQFKLKHTTFRVLTKQKKSCLDSTRFSDFKRKLSYQEDLLFVLKDVASPQCDDII